MLPNYDKVLSETLKPETASIKQALNPKVVRPQILKMIKAPNSVVKPQTLGPRKLKLEPLQSLTWRFMGSHKWCCK